MENQNVNVDPRYMKYDKEQVEKILDGACIVTDNDDPMSLVSD